MKTINTVVKSVVLVLAFCLAIPVLAATAKVGGVTWIYLVENGNATVTGVTPTPATLKIPSRLGGRPVTRIGYRAFAEKGITIAIIPGSVKEIEESAFEKCRYLQAVTIGNNVRSIGSRAFLYCDTLSSVTVGKRVQTIGNKVFWECYKLTRLRLPASVTHVGDLALDYPLRKLTVPASWRGTGMLANQDLSSTCEVVYRRFNYTVAFDANGGSGHMAMQTMTFDKTAKVRKNAFTRTGCTFIGWATSKGGAVVYKNRQAVKNLRTSSGTTRLYAKWAKKNYTVAFNSNGGRGRMAKQSMTWNTAAKLRRNAFKRRGCKFIGWAKKKNRAVGYQNRAKVKNLTARGGTLTLYAQWAKKTYKVAFDPNGGTGWMAAQTMTYGKTAKLAKNTFKRTGYTFAGWAKGKTGWIAYQNAASVKNLRTDGGTQTLYARWKGTPYKVAFNANGGTGWMALQTMTYGQAAYLSENAFERDGYRFLGWSKTPTGVQVYTDCQQVQNLRSDGGTTILYAQWEAIGIEDDWIDDDYYWDDDDWVDDGYDWEDDWVDDGENQDDDWWNDDDDLGYSRASRSTAKSLERASFVASDKCDSVGNSERVLVTASGGGDASAVVDGNETTSWTPDTAEGSWVVLTFAEPRDVEDVEVAGDNLPDGTRFLLSEDADNWQEGVPGRAQYVWVVFPASDVPPLVREIRVTP